MNFSIWKFLNTSIPSNNSWVKEGDPSLDRIWIEIWSSLACWSLPYVQTNLMCLLLFVVGKIAIFCSLSEHLIGSDVEQSWSGQEGKKIHLIYIYVPSFLWRTTHCFCVKSEAALQFPHYYDTKYQVVTKSINFNNKRTDAHSIAVSTVSPRLLEWLVPKKSLIIEILIIEVLLSQKRISLLFVGTESYYKPWTTCKNFHVVHSLTEKM